MIATLHFSHRYTVDRPVASRGEGEGGGGGGGCERGQSGPSYRNVFIDCLKSRLNPECIPCDSHAED